MVQTCWSRKATFFFLLLLSFLVRDYRDSLKVIYFKPRHNGPTSSRLDLFFIYSDSGSGFDPAFINPLYGLPLTIFARAIFPSV